mmetsp:Transcript_3783/g.6073  ORF Transcript_3783/g.6073 Transcript_3783/m.6073 type:complete len:259 (-) Transcript_3783:208-984(-)
MISRVEELIASCPVKLCTPLTAGAIDNGADVWCEGEPPATPCCDEDEHAAPPTPTPPIPGVERQTSRWYGQRWIPSLRQTCFNEVSEMPSALAASGCATPNMDSTVSRSTLTGNRPFSGKMLSPALRRGNRCTLTLASLVPFEFFSRISISATTNLAIVSRSEICSDVTSRGVASMTHKVPSLYVLPFLSYKSGAPAYDRIFGSPSTRSLYLNRSSCQVSDTTMQSLPSLYTTCEQKARSRCVSLTPSPTADLNHCRS